MKRRISGEFEYFVFKEHLYASESQRLLDAGGLRIDANALFSEVNVSFREDFVNWMVSLNNVNDTPFWHGLNLAGKSALSTRLCERTFYTACLRHLLAVVHGDVVVVFDDTAVIRQIHQEWGSEVCFDFRERKSLSIKTLAGVIPVRILHRFGVSLHRKLIAGSASIPKNHQQFVVIKTVISEGSFGQPKPYRDLYFGDFLDYLKEQKVDFCVIGIVVNAYHEYATFSKRHAQNNVLSIEQVLGFGDLCVCLFQAVWMFFRRAFLTTEVNPFRGGEMEWVVRDAVAEELRSSQFMGNAMSARATKKVFERNDVERFIFPFENRGWERLDMLMIQGENRKTSIIGYQHAAITRKHTEYFRLPNEKLPIPDKVICLGDVTARMLVEDGGYPAHIVRAGCALRQKPTWTSGHESKRSVRNVMVLLSTSVDYYERTITVLNAMFKVANEHSIRLRAHPVIPLGEKLKSKIYFPYSEDTANENDGIAWADVVLYSSSTTFVLNCLQRGKPVFYVPVDDYLDADPLFELPEARWVVRTKDDFRRAVVDVGSMDENKWNERVFRAQAYVRQYFGPVTQSALHMFLE